MRKVFGIIMAIMLLLPFGKVYSKEKSVRESNTLRLMSYNIRNGQGMDLVTDLQRIVDVIDKACPDVVAVQELDSVTKRSEGKDVLKDLASKTLMHYIYAPAIDFGGGKYGIGVLSKEKPLGYRYYPLPGKEEARVLLVVEFEKYMYASTHLSLREESRMKSFEIIKKVAEASNKPFFLAGDFNAVPESPFMKQIEDHFVVLTKPYAATYPADKPDRVIDYIVGYNRDAALFARYHSFVWEEPLASDHRPIIADVILAHPSKELFRMKPYLQNPRGNGMTVMWQTTVPAYGWVEYGTDPNNLQKVRVLVDGQALCNDIQHKVRLENLEPGQTYYYRVCSQEIILYKAYVKQFGEVVKSDLYSFTMPDKENTDFTAIVFNDLHKRTATLKALFDQVKDLSIDFAVFNGDCIDDPANHEQATNFLRDMNEVVGASQIPVFYMRGNHEIRHAYSIGLRNLLEYVGNNTYSAFNWGDTRIVMLDCGEDKPDSHPNYYGLNDFSELRNEQVDFLKKELSSKAFKKATKRVLIHHIPIYGIDTDYNPCLELWNPLLGKAPFDICLNAHTHKFAHHPKATVGNNFPVVIGGGPEMDKATIMILQKKGKEMTLRVLNSEGRELLNLKL
ncbi:MAG: metallophosphoesterase [Parabacteroides sp.]|nr:metallophosphoesterase [Parabacteroides sp.]